jgi:hypothetical protein
MIFEFEYLNESEFMFENNLGQELGTKRMLLMRKNGSVKSRASAPLRLKSSIHVFSENAETIFVKL